MLLNILGPLSVLFIAALPAVEAANSFAGSNLYYAAGLYEDDRTTLLEYAAPHALVCWGQKFT